MRRISDTGAHSCSCCEQPTEFIDDVSGAELCPDCAPLLRRALTEGGSILRSRCSPLLIGAPDVCGRAWKVVYQAARLGPIVADTSSACPMCRPAQRAYCEKRFGPIPWEDSAHA